MRVHRHPKGTLGSGGDTGAGPAISTWALRLVVFVFVSLSSTDFHLPVSLPALCFPTFTSSPLSPAQYHCSTFARYPSCRLTAFCASPTPAKSRIRHPPQIPYRITKPQSKPPRSPGPLARHRCHSPVTSSLDLTNRNHQTLSKPLQTSTTTSNNFRHIAIRLPEHLCRPITSTQVLLTTCPPKFHSLDRAHRKRER
jgi:hypothetical protein